MIKTRFAPSPTGFLHIGGLRTALYAYLFARQSKGHLILRIEDTDRTRLVEGAIENLIRTLEWANITYDEGPDPKDLTKMIGPNGPYIQSKRTELYREHADKLLESGNAYRCFCSIDRLDEMRKAQQKAKQAPQYDKHCLKRPKDEIKQLTEQNVPHVIRLNVPENDTLRFRDIVRGDLQFESHTIDDQVLMKSDGYPTYHLANVVDDHYMEITHVIRGEEWLPSTPKHVYLYKAFGWDMPQFAHIPLLLNKDKTKLSKRQNDVAVEDYMAKGYLTEAVINFIALLGWHPGSGEIQEIFSMEELIEKFNLKKVHKAGAIFDRDRLDWVNGHYIRELSLDELAERIYPWVEKADWFTGSLESLKTVYGLKVLKATQTRIKTLDEAPEMLQYFLEHKMQYDLALLYHEKMKIDAEMAKTALQAAHDDLSTHDDFSSEDILKECLVKTIERLGMKNGQVLWPLRVALTGVEFSPGVFELIEILGKERTLDRIQQTLDRL
ncbi:MAG: glutamate--tRNA ligase [Candidatus Peregrinibacteria bacterium]|nr:glutamate--tRNA ligase [Candidatus Peregrinibacteria bacterium]